MIIRDFAAARHLASRLEIGTRDTLIQARVGAALTQVFASMLPPADYVVGAPEITPWAEVAAFYDADITAQRAIRLQAQRDSEVLSTWWLQHIHQTQYPLLERMTLFWHSHFATNLDKVTWPQLMLRQNQLLRQHALGNFADLLRALLHDPALLMFLDGGQNTASDPDETLARALLADFTLGDGHYHTQDIAQAARAFTGWRVDLRKGEFAFQAAVHDAGKKSFMEQHGAFGGEDIITMLLAHERTAAFIAEKFWGAFINHDQPDPAVINDWAHTFRESGYDIKTLLRAVLHSAVFQSEQNHAALIKAPLELTLGLLRELDSPPVNYAYLNTVNTQLGQTVFKPPARGWRGGTRWINSQWLTRRYDVLSKLWGEHGETGTHAVRKQGVQGGLLNDPAYQLR